MGGLEQTRPAQAIRRSRTTPSLRVKLEGLPKGTKVDGSMHGMFRKIEIDRAVHAGPAGCLACGSAASLSSRACIEIESRRSHGEVAPKA
jgi:hypothetical protein